MGCGIHGKNLRGRKEPLLYSLNMSRASFHVLLFAIDSFAKGIKLIFPNLKLASCVLKIFRHTESLVTAFKDRASFGISV